MFARHVTRGERLAGTLDFADDIRDTGLVTRGTRRHPGLAGDLGRGVTPDRPQPSNETRTCRTIFELLPPKESNVLTKFATEPSPGTSVSVDFISIVLYGFQVDITK